MNGSLFLPYGLSAFLLFDRELSVLQIFFLQAVLLLTKRGAAIPIVLAVVRFGQRACVNFGYFLYLLVVALIPWTDDFVAFLSLFVMHGIALAFVGGEDTAQTFVGPA